MNDLTIPSLPDTFQESKAKDSPPSISSASERLDKIKRATRGITHPEEVFQEQFLEIQKKRIFSHLDNSGIPEDFYKYSILENSDKKKYIYRDISGKDIESRKKAYSTVLEYIKPGNVHNNIRSGKSVYIFGEQNSNLGISLLCTFLLRGCMEADYHGKYISFINLCNNLVAAGYEDKNEFYETPVLMVDTIIVNNNINDRLRGRLSSFLKHRSDKKLATFFASHTSFSNFMSTIDESLIYSYENSCERIDILKAVGAAGGESLSLDGYIASLNKNFSSYPFVTYEKLEAHLKEFKKAKK